MLSATSSSDSLLLAPPDARASAAAAAAIETLATPPSIPDAAATRVRPRDPDLDALRVIGAAGVVWIHAAFVLNDGVGRFAVPMFIVAAVLLTAASLRRRPEQSTLGFVGKRWLRLGPAFLFWCVVYEAMRQAKWVMHGGVDAIRVEPLRFIGGTYEHLWYLPYLLVATLAIVPVLKVAVAGSARRRAAIAIIAFAAGVAMAVAPVPATIAKVSLQGPWQFLRPAWWATPSLLVGVALACATLDRGGLGGLRMPRYAGVVGLAMLVGGSWVNWSVDDQPHLLAVTVSGVGAVWLSAAAILPRRVANALAPLGASLCMGIYLSHVLFLRVWVIVAEHERLPTSATTDVLSFAFALVGSAALSALLNRSRWTRWTIGF